jgi:pimeloyl-ACP methyl ester carboxylesterase
MKAIIVALFSVSLLSGQFSWSEPKSLFGFVEVRGKKMYVEYTQPIAGKSTAIIVNGLTYSTRNYFVLAQHLRARGYGVLLFDLNGMGSTLLANPLPSKPIVFTEQVLDMRRLFRGLGLKPPYNLVGLSYGGGLIAAYATRFPEDVQNLVMINPYTEFLDSQKQWIQQQIKNVRLAFPQNPATDEELTDYFIRQLVYTTYPMAEISSLENPYKLEGITRLVQGIRMYQPVEEAKAIPRKALHLVISEMDQYIPQSVYSHYWAAVPQTSRANLTYVSFAEHKLPEQFPLFTAQYIKGVLDGQPLLFSGQTLQANPITLKISEKR